MHLHSSMRRIIAVVYFPLAVIYLFLSFIYPTDPVTMVDHHLNITEARVLAMTLATIYILIWILAFFAARELTAYSRSIRQYKDGEAFFMLASALLAIAIYLPFRNLTKILLNYAAYLHPAFTTTSSVTITYINIVFPLVIYVYISMGGSRLLHMVRTKIPLQHVCALALLLCVIAATYCYAAFSSSTKLTPANWFVTVDYQINVPFRIFTVVVPHLFMWAIGLIGTYQIYFYQQKVRGIIYKHSLKMLSVGITLQIITTIAVQYLIVIAANIEHLPVGVMLLLAVTLLTTVTVAYVMIVRGINRLRIFEELI